MGARVGHHHQSRSLLTNRSSHLNSPKNHVRSASAPILQVGNFDFKPAYSKSKESSNHARSSCVLDFNLSTGRSSSGYEEFLPKVLEDGIEDSNTYERIVGTGEETAELVESEFGNYIVVKEEDENDDRDFDSFLDNMHLCVPEDSPEFKENYGVTIDELVCLWNESNKKDWKWELLYSKEKSNEEKLEILANKYKEGHQVNDKGNDFHSRKETLVNLFKKATISLKNIFS